MINKVVSLVANLEESQWFPLEVLHQIQEKDLVRLVRHHAEHTPWFVARLREQNLAPSDLWTLKGLKQYKPFTKRDIQQAAAQFTANAVPDVYKPVGHVESSGSTGQPVSIDKTSINNVFWAAHTLRDHAWYKRDFTHKMVSIRATFKDHEVYRDNWGAPVAILHKDNGKALGIPVNWGTNRQLALIEEFQPEILVLNGGVLQALVTLWERDGCKLTNLKHIKQVGDTVHEPLRERVRALFDLEIEDNYSSSEVGCIALQCPESGLYHIMAENLIVEILDADGNDCKPGEIGRVVVTDLHNLAAPVIRYDLGDYAEVGTPCTCGRHLPTLKRIIGRERGLFVKPDGSRFWPRGGYRNINSFKVRQFQMIQHAVDDIEYRIVTDEPLTAEQEAEAIEAIEAVFEMPNTVRIVRYENEIPLVNGKYEESICLIK